MDTDKLIIVSLALKDCPYDWKFARFNGAEGGWSVELHTKDGNFWGSGTDEDSLVLAYTRAENDLINKMGQHDYAMHLAYEEMGTGRM